MRVAARWFLLLAIFGILGWLWVTYQVRRRTIEEAAPPKPAMLPLDVAGKAEDWHRVKYDEKGRRIFEIWARNFKQEKDSSRVELERVRLHLFRNGGDQFDSVESPSATFHPHEGKLYSEGDVSITLAVPSEGLPAHGLVSIRTSGVVYDSATSVASTDRPADFIFENGTGKCVGAVYDPNTRELRMRSSVELNLKAREPAGKPMKLESGQLIYKETESKILLSPWARLKRGDTSTLEGGDTVVTLTKEGTIQLVEAQTARGVDLDPKRRVEYSADRLTVRYTEDGVVDKVTGEPNARLVSSTEYARTTTTSDRIDLEFDNKDQDGVLKTAFARGHSVVESKPITAPAGRPLPDTRVLRSEVIEMKMRPGGQEIDTVETKSPGHIDFIPNHAGSRRRQMDGSKIDIAYGELNQIRTFRSVDVETQTAPSKPNGAPVQTWSKNLLADFDPETGNLTRMRQWENFRYVEGERKAVASKATLQQDTGRIKLETAARVWDPTGSTAADVIDMDQSSGDFTATGHVASSRVQDKKTPNSGLLSGEEPVQATAERMRSTNRNALVVYEGKADMWQGASRIRADRIDIDREARRLVAAGAVHTQLLEKEKAAGAKAAASPIFTNVKSAGLVYTESDRLAHYTGGVLLTRPSLRVKSLELRSFLSEDGEDNSLEKAYADGKVELQQSVPGRTRTGTSEHAEYFVGDEKIILRGGSPMLVDSVKGNTKGDELTYFSSDDRLLVNGAPERPATSRLRKN